MSTARAVNALADVICRAQKNGRRTPVVEWLLDEVDALRARVAELEQERHTTNNAVAEAHLALAAAAESRPVDEDPIAYALTEPEPDTPGRRAADAIQAMHDPTVIGYNIGVDWLSLTLKPRTLADWQAWLDRLGADLAHVTHRGLLSTAKGSWDGVPVAVQAHGVGALLAAARTATGSGAV
ncbi:MAG TPA: hypothetical protein DEQ61_19985 [Streptomyces sp.]|nr:hypothetical protein [Streptomyces sp.]